MNHFKAHSWAILLGVFSILGCQNNPNDEDSVIAPTGNFIEASTTFIDAKIDGVAFNPDYDSPLNIVIWEPGVEFTFLINSADDDGWIEIVIYGDDAVGEYPLTDDEQEPHGDYITWNTDVEPAVFRSWRGKDGFAKIETNDGVTATGSFEFTGILVDSSGSVFSGNQDIEVRGKFKVAANSL